MTSKTTQLAAMMSGEGRIVANDNNRVRFFRLKANIEMQGAQNVELSMRYGETFGRDFPDTFDRVLADVPCSAEGRFFVRKPATFGYWKPKKIKEMVRKQKKLLFSGMKSLKPQGTLVYSTCTFAPEENEATVDWLLTKTNKTLKVIKADSYPILTYPTITQWNNKIFDNQITNCLRIFPSEDMECFFIAKLMKVG